MAPFMKFLVAAALLAVGASGDEISDVACAGRYTFTDYTATFVSPGNPGLYPNNAHCEWLITGQEAGGFVELSFSLLSLESNYDHLIIYDGDSTLAPILTGFDGTWNPAPHTIRSTQGLVLVTFSSDSTINNVGFTVTYNSVSRFDVRDPCSSLSRPLLVTDGAGEIASPYSENNYYLNYANCQWLIESQVPNGIVSLDFLGFSIERHVDYVYLFDGPTTGSPQIAKLNGTSPVTTGWSSTGGYLLVQFTSNSWNVGPGWRASYSSHPRP